jgi:MoaA/NifB/PqqE/SkfB family radical SAM enzyme
VQQHIASGNTELDSLPLYYLIRLTSVCNIKCVMCNYPDLLRHYAMPEHWMDEILASKSSIYGMTLSGGEPFLSPLALDALKAGADSSGLHVHAVSNLSIRRKGLPEAIVNGAASISCSMDAATRETYDKIRQDSNYETVIHNLREIVRLRRAKGSRYPRVEINFTIMGNNDHEIVKFVELAHELGVDSVSFKWLIWVKTPRITQEVAFDFADDAKVRALCESMLKADKLAQDWGIVLSWESPPFHIKNNRPDIFAEYASRFASEISSWSVEEPSEADGYGKPAPQQSPDVAEPASHDDELANRTAAMTKLASMPDGLMPCTAPFHGLNMLSVRAAAFCCESLAKYRSIPIDPSKSLAENWNNPLFQEARSFFHKGEYEKVCHPQCRLYRNYLQKMARRLSISGSNLARGGARPTPRQ